VTIPSPIDRFPGVIGTFMGRDALTLASSYLEVSPADRVLMPAYSCKEVLRPFLKRAQVEFYDVLPDLTIDVNDLRLKFGSGKYKALLIINYFGFLQPFRTEIRHVCKEQGVVLIEDCAHSLLTTGSGETGDVAVFSFRKTLPIPDGGGLKLSENGKSVRARFYPTVFSNVLSTLILAKSKMRVRSQFFSRAGLTSGNGDISRDTASRNKENRILPLSSFARAGLAHASFEDIVSAKRRDFEFWLRVCKTSSIATPVYAKLPEGVCPLGFPVKVQDRDSFILRARKLGIDLLVHWRLPAKLGTECGTSHLLSTQMLTLPIYPDLAPKHREELWALLATAESKLSRETVPNPV
jgi:perosamine synthetase